MVTLMTLIGLAVGVEQGRLQEFGLWYADMRPMKGRGVKGWPQFYGKKSNQTMDK